MNQTDDLMYLRRAIALADVAVAEQRLGELTGDDPENPTQDLDCRTIFASGQRAVEVRGPFPALEDRIEAQHVAFWGKDGSP